MLVCPTSLTEPNASLRVGQPVTHGTPPAPRFNHSAALLGYTELAVFGGLGGDGRQVTPSHRPEGRDPPRRRLHARPIRAPHRPTYTQPSWQVLGDVGLLHVATMRWSAIEFRGVPPVPRAAAIGASVPFDRRFWVFGGAAVRQPACD